MGQRAFHIICYSCAVLMVGTLSTAQGAEPGHLLVGDFSAGNLNGWVEKSFSGKTNYRFVETDTGTALEANSTNSASGLFREMTIDLTKTPCLTWAWKVDNSLGGLDETSKAGDDYSARVYVVFSGGLFPWNTRTFSYVWSGSHAVGSSWPNAFSDNATTVAVQSGDDAAGRWVSQCRNVVEDYRRFVGGEIKQADAVAIMTDTDGSGRTASAWYGDIRFTASCG